MAFIEIHKSRNAPLHKVIMVPQISVIVAKSNEQHVYIRLPREIVHNTWHDKLINDGRSIRLGLLEGTDTDAGFIMLVHNPRGYTFSASSYAKADGTPSHAAFVSKIDLSTFKSYIPNITPQLPTEMEYSIDGQAMLLQMPQWFVYTPKVVHRATMVATQKVREGRPPAALMNDAQRRSLR